jgi:hypothetical protein
MLGCVIIFFSKLSEKVKANHIEFSFERESSSLQHMKSVETIKKELIDQIYSQDSRSENVNIYLFNVCYFFYFLIYITNINNTYTLSPILFLFTHKKN